MMRRIQIHLLSAPLLIDIDPGYQTRARIPADLSEMPSDTTFQPFLSLSNVDWSVHLLSMHASPIGHRSLHSRSDS
jgi:hypothetical protein